MCRFLALVLCRVLGDAPIVAHQWQTTACTVIYLRGNNVHRGRFLGFPTLRDAQQQVQLGPAYVGAVLVLLVAHSFVSSVGSVLAGRLAASLGVNTSTAIKRFALSHAITRNGS